MSQAARIEKIGNATLYLGDCREIMPTLDAVDHVISDPPYEAVTQNKWGVLNGVDYRDFTKDGLRFEAIDGIREDAAKLIAASAQGWAIVFCQAEGVRAWRDAFAATPAKYKRALVWVKTDAMPQFNGQGPSVGHEMMVAVWCGKGHSHWNGGGRPGTFTYPKNSGGKHEHPTQKPLPLMRQLVALFTDQGQTVLDPFMGSGTTGLAALAEGRSFVGIEVNPKYYEIALQRLAEAIRQPDFFVDTRESGMAGRQSDFLRTVTAEDQPE
jgi:site-specific DNA-methyltransferase (adenine-specific)